jgi:hypothetical protein
MLSYIVKYIVTNGGGFALVKEYVCPKSGYFISPERKDNIHLNSFS